MTDKNKPFWRIPLATTKNVNICNQEKVSRFEYSKEVFYPPLSVKLYQSDGKVYEANISHVDIKSGYTRLVTSAVLINGKKKWKGNKNFYTNQSTPKIINIEYAGGQYSELKFFLKKVLRAEAFDKIYFKV